MRDEAARACCCALKSRVAVLEEEGVAGADGRPAGFSYLFNTATSGDPGSGKILLNNATVASATAFNISETDNLSQAIAAVLAQWDDSSSTIKGQIVIEDPAAPTNFAIFNITGTLTDSGAYDTFAASYVTGGGAFTNNLPVQVRFSRTGDIGATGATGANGAAGATGATGATGAVAGFSYLFNTATSGDPGSGKLLLNNATVALATAFNISETDNASQAIAAVLATWDDSSSTIKGQLLIEDPATPTNFAVFAITGTLTDNGTYDTFSATYVTGGGTFTNNLAVKVRFSRTGDIGATGATGATGSTGSTGATGAAGVGIGVLTALSTTGYFS